MDFRDDYDDLKGIKSLEGEYIVMTLLALFLFWYFVR